MVLAVYIGFVGFVVYVDTFDFPWFGGYLNIVFITLMNVLFALMVRHAVYGKRKDPYMAAEDRARSIEVTVASLSFISIAATIYSALSISLAAFELRRFTPLMTSVYFQMISVAAFRSFRLDDVNFEVYREGRAAAA